jgi:hypothetical protein
MTTELEWAENIYEDNDVFLAGPQTLGSHFPIAALSVTVPDKYAENIVAMALASALSRFDTAKLRSVSYALVSNEVDQPDNSITRHWGIRALLKYYSLNVDKREIVQTSHMVAGGVRFTAAVPVSLDCVNTVAKFIEIPACYIGINIEPPTIDKILTQPWHGNVTSDAGVIQQACAEGGLLIKKFGAFDDRRRGVVLFAQQLTFSDLTSIRVRRIR